MLRAWRALVVVCALGLIAGCASGASSASADVRVVAAVSARLDQVASARMTSTVTARRDGRTIVMLALSGAIRFSDHAIRLAGTGSAADHSLLPKVEMIVRDQASTFKA